MKYMLLVYGREGAMSDAERDECYMDSAALARELAASGHYLAAAPLQSVAEAASVRVREGKRIVSDGPFAETYEQLGGYFLVEAASREEALAIAERIPGARMGTIEVRPALEIAGLPEEPASREMATA